MAPTASQRAAHFLEIRGIEEAVRYFDRLPALAQEEIGNTLEYAGNVIKAKLMAALPSARGQMDDRTKKKGQATGRGRASVAFKVRRPNATGRGKTARLTLEVFPRRRYLFMLGWGWRRRKIVYYVRNRAEDVKARVARNGMVRRRIVTRGTSRRERYHELQPHPIAPPIQTAVAPWVNQQIVLAINRATREGK